MKHDATGWGGGGTPCLEGKALATSDLTLVEASFIWSGDHNPMLQRKRGRGPKR